MLPLKKFLSFFLLLLVFASPIEVYAVSWPKVSNISRDIEKRYHLNQESLRSLGEGLNVSEQKKTAPEVLLFFSPSNPVPGKEITAQANPLYFSNPKEDLYFTWYLKHKDCDTDGSVQKDDKNKFCDADDNGKIDQEDWKVEAMRLIVNAGLDPSRFETKDTDNDGYQAHFGGNSNKRMTDRCYIQDFTTGTLYELSSGSSSTSYGCPAGQVARCVENSVVLSCADQDYTICKNIGITPTCEDSEVSCPGAGSVEDGLNPNITARCVPSGFATPVCTDPGIQNTDCSSIGSLISSCSVSPSGVSGKCEHLFPNSPGDTTGDGEFKSSEEEFWNTDPQDPDTGDTGYGDEATLAGLGQDSFTWLYEVGDMVGVAVEGTSIIPTKHDESSYATMWALPKNDCPIEDTSSYQKTIRTYDVTFKTTTTDINDCLERNLVDPREGGQTGKINLSLNYTPETVFNDASGDNFGTKLTVSSTIENTESLKDMLHYEWKVFISSDGSFNPRAYSADPKRDGTQGWVNITEKLRDKKLISFTEGNGLNSVTIDLNLEKDAFDYFSNEKGYIKVEAHVKEYVDIDKKVREDISSIIIPITSTDQYISAKGVSVDGTTGKLLLGDPFCEEKVDFDDGDKKINPLGFGRNICLVVKNEIVGLEIKNDDSSLSDFYWSANNQPLTCTNEMSAKCNASSATNVTFLPITGNPGEKYDVSLTAINAGSGEKINISRTFLIIDPIIEIQSTNTDLVWPKYLGYYKDAQGFAYADYSKEEFQGYPGGSGKFSLKFIPSFIKNRSHWDWSLNGKLLQNGVSSVEFPLGNSIGDISTLSVSGSSSENDSIRNALQLFWGYSSFDSSEYTFAHKIQIQSIENFEEEEDESAFASPKAFFATLAKNASQQFLFVVQLFLWIGMLIVLLGGIFSLSEKK